jgi:hypothetical protein
MLLLDSSSLTNQVYLLPRQLLHDRLCQYGRSFGWCTGCRHPGHQTFCSENIEGFPDASPVGDGEGGDAGADGDGVKAQQAVAEYDGVLTAFVCSVKIK